MAEILAYCGMVTVALITAFGQLFYKKASLSPCNTLFGKVRNPNFIAGSAVFIIAPFISYFVLKTIPFSLFYIFTSLNNIFIIILSSRYLNEEIDRRKLTGVGLIVIGLILYNLPI